MTPAEREEIQALLDALAEETIAPDQVRRLEELVLAYPEAEAFYVQYMGLVADLSRHFAAAPPPTEQTIRQKVEAIPAAAEPVRPAAARRTWVRPWMVGLAALAGCVLVAIGLWPRPIVYPPHRPGEVAERTDETVAVLLQTHNAEWEDTGMPTRPGSPLPPGRLVLKSGHAHLEFYNGATVILEGPAELRLISRTQAFCERGKLRATVPPQAHGFAIGSPSMDLIDRGTEFGLSVGDGKTDLHVFQGQVDVYNPGAEPKAKALQMVTGGQGVSRQGPGAVSPIRPNPGSFLSAAEMTARAEAATRQRQAEWAEASKVLRQDPSLVVYYTFQDDPARSRTLHDSAGDQANPRNGAIVGCQWGAGRWHGRDGLEFKRVSDRVRLKVPGEFGAVTLAAWVRPDALPNQNNSLMMADGWPTGGPHWQIGVDGTVILGVKAPPELEAGPMGRGAHYRAYNVFTPERFGRWVHLAVTYDTAAGLVTHYVDGHPVVEYEMESEIPLRFGDAELGNWNAATFRNKHPVRNFNGAMDEFMLFSRALTAAEVEKLYAQGRPPG
jgi:ferric-dicitrate binding protein FerR (iron transport regulator)